MRNLLVVMAVKEGRGSYAGQLEAFDRDVIEGV
jgi:hypothetical protein